MQNLVDLLLHLLPSCLAQLHDQLAAEVRGHDENGVLEINRSAVAVRHAAVIQDLQQHIENIRMRLFDLIKENDRIGFTPHRLGQMAALLIAHIAGRGADQPGHRMLLHELRHVKADHGLLAVKEKGGQAAGQLCFADAGGAEENK